MKVKTVRVDADALARLCSAGSQMANLCFNLEQSERVPAEYRATMKELQRQWDRLRPGVAAVPARRKAKVKR